MAWDCSLTVNSSWWPTWPGVPAPSSAPCLLRAAQFGRESSAKVKGIELQEKPEKAAASADTTHAQNKPTNGKDKVNSSFDAASIASAGLKAWGDAMNTMGEASAGLMARAEPATASVRTTATGAVRSAEEAAGNVKARVTGWFQKTLSTPEDGNSAAAPNPKVASESAGLGAALRVIWVHRTCLIWKAACIGQCRFVSSTSEHSEIS